MGLFGKLFGKKDENQEVVVSAVNLNPGEVAAVVSGETVALSTVNDPVFSSEMMGKGIAIKPSANEVYAPVNGELTVFYPSMHAYGIKGDDGVEILIHIGIDTVNLEGKHFTSKKKQGDRLVAGELLGTFDRNAISKDGYDITVMLIVTNTDNYAEVAPVKTGEVAAKEVILNVK
ncbi:PTS sugar transporter subunit IIA [Enterococcus cecorum]|uniref:PTS sugar transporter subunit IIA n=1 Tax=Enterococcus cecorum TaxID=44008 RepID=UPI0032C47130